VDRHRRRLRRQERHAVRLVAVGLHRCLPDAAARRGRQPREAITFTKTEAGIVATLNSEEFIFPEELGAYIPQEDGSALLPTEAIVFEEECEPTPTPEPSEPSVAPSEEATVSPVDEPSASPSPAAEEPEELAATGATVGGAIAFAALLAIGGVALVWARKRMQHNA